MAFLSFCFCEELPGYAAAQEDIIDEGYEAPAENVEEEYAAPAARSGEDAEDVFITTTVFSVDSRDSSVDATTGVPTSDDEATTVPTESDEDESACPGEDLNSCLMSCPGSSTRIFGACVSECDLRCAP